MKAITIWQPWASLLACGAKCYETRGWATKYRGPIAIHAAMRDPARIPHSEELDKFASIVGSAPWDQLPRGAVIATAELVNVWRIVLNLEQSDGAHKIAAEDQNGNYIIPSEMELALGDWTPGRYAWEFANMKPIAPIPAKGKQGLWSVEFPYQVCPPARLNESKTGGIR